MRVEKGQSGKSNIGWLILLAVIFIVTVPGVKIIPIYLKDMKINDTLKKLETDVLKATGGINHNTGKNKNRFVEPSARSRRTGNHRG